MSGIPYHAWTHRPKEEGGTDPLPGSGDVALFRAKQFTNITGLTGTAVNLDWDEWENGDTTVFEPRGVSVNPPASGTDILRAVRILQPGRYIFQVGVNLTATVNGCKIALNDGDPAPAYSEDHYSGPTTNYNLTGWISACFAVTFPVFNPGSTVWPDFDLSEFADIYFTVAVNIASGTRTIDDAFLQVSYETATFPA